MIIFALRHADREEGDALSDAGKIRAKLLARMLQQSDIQKAYCSDAKRTQATIAPLKALLGEKLIVEAVPVGSNVNDHVHVVVAALKALPVDSTAAVIGHSNTIDLIIKALTGNTIAPIGPNEFDRLFVLSIPEGSPSLTLLRYGEPTY